MGAPLPSTSTAKPPTASAFTSASALPSYSLRFHSDRSPEVVHDHQIVHREVHSGIENRAAVAGCSEPEEHIAEIWSHCRGAASPEIEVPKPCLTCGSIN